MTTLVVGSSMATLDTAIANTALPTIAADLRASAEASIWIINAYQLGKRCGGRTGIVTLR